ncbi:MAG TPA: choline ABC transporter ATP-binding protein [Aestuariivirgaceae bacterium]|jgi:glycine betaine/proline transport system ATP-binding protein|nr:choline ABC transporter ATP-binding protein [Aestuariivirgaceae bacterium]
MTTAVSFRDVDIIFGRRTREALELLDRGETRGAILDKTGAVLGVAGASLDVGEGEICVLMGLSGSGKSTLLRAVNGLNKPVRGGVMVHAGDRIVDVTHCRFEELRQLRMHGVAMVFQQFGLLPWRTVAENAGLGLELAGIDPAERRDRVARQLKLVGLDQWANKYAHELSGGMQQRVGLARAFATEAPILLMDEPFSALDPLIRTHLQDELLELQRKLRRTIVFVSHDLDEALKIGTHIAIMEGGRIVQHGPPQDIVLNPANDYVAAFVQHMNPLNVLTGDVMMTPLPALKRIGPMLMLDDDLGLTLAVDDAGAAERAALGEHQLKVFESNGEASSWPRGEVVVMPHSAPMRVVIDARRQSGLPILLAQDGRIIGVVRDDDIYSGLLARATAQAHSPA